MGFMDGLGRFIQGKPVFQPSSDQPLATDGPVEEGMSEDALRGKKVIPVIVVDRCQSHLNPPHMRVSCEIRNTSQDKTIEIDKITMMGTTRELDTYLRPGESRELIIYDGHMPQNRNYTTAEIPYKDETGDYFSMQCNIEYNQESNNLYSISNIRTMGVPKDI